MAGWAPANYWCIVAADFAALIDGCINHRSGKFLDPLTLDRDPWNVMDDILRGRLAKRSRSPGVLAAASSFDRCAVGVLERGQFCRKLKFCNTAFTIGIYRTSHPAWFSNSARALSGIITRRVPGGRLAGIKPALIQRSTVLILTPSSSATVARDKNFGNLIWRSPRSGYWVPLAFRSTPSHPLLYNPYLFTMGQYLSGPCPTIMG